MSTVAIDGPAGAGKSSVARAVAEALGFRYLDTGAMYRAVALAVLESDVDVHDENAVGSLVRRLEIDLDGHTVHVDGRDVTSRLRGKDVTEHAARIARHGAVREALVAHQRKLAASGDVVMEGRDIGTEVLPGADVKIFLTASLGERARRRSRQLGLSDDGGALSEIQADIERRDHSDRNRDISPLIEADDATVVDTTGMPLEDVVQHIAEIVRRAIGGPR